MSIMDAARKAASRPTRAELIRQLDGMRAALWPFAMKALKGTAVCEDDYRRAGEAMPYAPDFENTQQCDDCGEPFRHVPNSGDKWRCDKCRQQYG